MSDFTDQLRPGLRVYTTGDRCNDAGPGTIYARIDDPKWGSSVSIRMDDGRMIRHLPLRAFSKEYKGHGGTRWVTLEAYNQYQKAMCEMHYQEAR